MPSVSYEVKLELLARILEKMKRTMPDDAPEIPTLKAIIIDIELRRDLAQATREMKGEK